MCIFNNNKESKVRITQFDACNFVNFPTGLLVSLIFCSKFSKEFEKYNIYKGFQLECPVGLLELHHIVQRIKTLSDIHDMRMDSFPISFHFYLHGHPATRLALLGVHPLFNFPYYCLLCTCIISMRLRGNKIVVVVVVVVIVVVVVVVFIVEEWGLPSFLNFSPLPFTPFNTPGS